RAAQGHRADSSYHAHAFEWGPAAFGLQARGFDGPALRGVYFYIRIRLHRSSKYARWCSVHHLYHAVQTQSAIIDCCEHKWKLGFQAGPAEWWIVALLLGYGVWRMIRGDHINHVQISPQRVYIGSTLERGLHDAKSFEARHIFFREVEMVRCDLAGYGHS